MRRVPPCDIALNEISFCFIRFSTNYFQVVVNYNLKIISAEPNETETDLIQGNVTRWDSTHDLIESVVAKFKSL